MCSDTLSLFENCLHELMPQMALFVHCFQSSVIDDHTYTNEPKFGLFIRWPLFPALFVQWGTSVSHKIGPTFHYDVTDIVFVAKRRARRLATNT